MSSFIQLIPSMGMFFGIMDELLVFILVKIGCLKETKSMITFNESSWSSLKDLFDVRNTMLEVAPVQINRVER